MRIMPRLLAAILIVAAVLQAKAEQPSITNDLLRITADDTGGFGIETLAAGKSKNITGKIEGATAVARRETINDPTFGNGEALVWSTGKIMAFPKLPFALLQGALKNDGADVKTINRVPLVSFDASSDRAAAKLKTLGTGGLLSPDKNPGSYAWLAVADPETRNSVVSGWLTHDRASGILFSDVKDGKVIVNARSDYGRLQLAPGKTAETETLAIGYFDDGRLGLEAYADAVAKVYHIKLPPAPVGFCTWYAEKHGGAADEKSLAELVALAAEELKPYGFEFVQIDDKWQEGNSQKNGPNKNFTTFRPNGPYPSGMKAAAENIKQHGMRPGIWFMPFAGSFNDPWFKDHQDWFVKGTDGKPFDVKWGGTSLDMTIPEVRDYLQSIVHRIAKDWGYTYFKMDGLYTGLAVDPTYINSGYKEDNFGNAVFADPAKTNVEAFRSGLQLVRDTVGPDVFFLGCTAAQNMRTYGASFGLVDGMRVGPDNKGNWKDWSTRSPVYGSRHYFLNGRVWWNDPDPTYLRKSIESEDARTIASWAGIVGQLNSNSDWIPDLSDDRIELLRRTMQSHGKTARPVDLFQHEPPRIWQVTDEATKDHSRRDVVALFNWSDAEAEIEVPIASLNLPKADNFAVFDYWENALPFPKSKEIKLNIPKHGCKILAIRPVEDHPFLISSSQHVTQGMTDIDREQWNSAEKKLSGESKLVGGDPYELRIVWMKDSPGGSSKLDGVAVSADDRAAGVEITAEQSKPTSLWRIKIKSPTSRTVHWTVPFGN